MANKPGSPTPMFSMGLPSPQPIVTRPLLGIDWSGPETNLKPGAFLDLQDLVVTQKGLYRIPGYDSFLGGAQWYPRESPVLLTSSWGTNGVQYPYLITENRVFYVTPTAYQLIAWGYSDGTVKTNGLDVTGQGTLWLDLGINSGDLITISGVDYVIDTVVSNTEILLRSTAGVQASWMAYSISRLLNASSLGLVDSCQVNDITLGQYLAIASPNVQPIKILPIVQSMQNLIPSAAKQPASGGFKAQAIAFSLGRVFCGNLQDGSLGQARTRIRWSKTTDTTDFSDPTAYLDLMSQASAFSGAIQRMVPLGTMLVVYLDDAIFVGSPSNTPNLPLSFQQIPTGRVGIAGPRAVVSVALPRDETNVWGVNTTGHFFVGFDNVYFLSSSNLSLMPIGTNIVRESIFKCKYPSRIQTAIDWPRRRIRFGFPMNTSKIEKIFEYCWETKEWSYEARTTSIVASLSVSSSWDLIQMATVLGDVMVTMNTGDDMCLSQGVPGNMQWSHFVDNNNYSLWASSSNENDSNPDGSVLPIRIETPDYDEGAPGMVKFWKLLRLKLNWDPETVPNADIVLNVELSVNRGRDWRPLGLMTIAQGNDEGYINFRATGPHIRFRLTSSSKVTPYYIVEMTRLASLRGVQTDRRQQNASS